MTDKLRKLGKDKRDEVLSGKKTSGFTIIEVALVLAIAALIFLVVFLAVPALQRNQRDDGRRRDIASIVNAGTTLYSNLNNWWTAGDSTVVYETEPTGGASAVNKNSTVSGTTLNKYIDTLSNGVSTVISNAPRTSVGTNWKPTDVGTIVVTPGLTCGTAPGSTPVVGTTRTAAVVGLLESGSSTYCQSIN